MKTPRQVFACIALLMWIQTTAFTNTPLAKHGSLKVSLSRPCCPPLLVVDANRQENGEDGEPVNSIAAGASTSRRRLLLASLPYAASSAVTAAAVHVSSPRVLAAFALDEPTNKDSTNKTTKVLVLGGTGLVGAQVVRTLQELGIETISTSRDGRDGTIALDFVNADGTAAILDRLSKLASGCTAVISCVGTVGTPNDFHVNAGTSLAAQAARSVGVERFVYISVAPEVKEFARDIEFLQDYMKGKTVSRDAVLTLFPPNDAKSSSSTLIEPTFIYGGGSFNVNPPRVAGFYGKVIEGLLSSSPIRSVERILSPGIIKIALEPPVSVESVASAAVAGALGKSPFPILDSYDKIKQAASNLQT